MSRSPADVQAEIELSRHQLANSLDQLVERANPKRLADEVKATVMERLNSPAGRAVAGTAAGLVLLLVVRRVRARHHD